MPVRRLDIPAERAALAVSVKKLDEELFELSGKSDTDVLKLQRLESEQRDKRKRIRERGLQLNELERCREIRRVAREVRERQKIDVVGRSGGTGGGGG